MSDNHGLQQAFYAYKMHVAKHGKEKKLPFFDRFTHEQLFFISYGNVSGNDFDISNSFTNCSCFYSDTVAKTQRKHLNSLWTMIHIAQTDFEWTTL